MLEWLCSLACLIVWCWSTVALAAPAATTEPWRPGPNHAEAFDTLLSPGTAPAVVHVVGIGFPLQHGTPITARYDWDFGDPHSPLNNLPGFNAAHVYDMPGHYVITLKVTDDTGVTRSATGSIVINPDRRREIFVSPEGSDMNVGTSPDAPYRTLGKAFKAASIDGCEVLLRAGVTFTADNVLKISHSDMVLGRYGEGPDPTVMLIRQEGPKAPHGFISIDNRCNGVTIQHLIFDTPYGVKDDQPAPKIGIDAMIARGRNITVRNCTFLNLDNAVNANGSPVGLMVTGCRAPLKTGLRAYLVWTQGSEFVCLNNEAANSTREHIVRLSGVQRALIAGNHFANLDRRPADKDDYSKGTIEMHTGSYAWIANNDVTGGTIRVGPLGLHGEDASSATDWSVVENNRVNDTFIVAYSGAHHVLIRDNVIRNNIQQSIQLQGPDRQGRVNSDIRIINNTAIDNGTTGAFLKVWGHVDGIDLEDNRFIAPNLRVGQSGAAAVNVVEPDLSSFSTIRGNVWPIFGHPGGGEMLLNNHLITAKQWSAFPQVKGDVFTDAPSTQRAPATNP